MYLSFHLLLLIFFKQHVLYWKDMKAALVVCNLSLSSLFCFVLKFTRLISYISYKMWYFLIIKSRTLWLLIIKESSYD